MGERDLTKKDGWVAFFDNPYTRPHATFLGRLETTGEVLIPCCTLNGKRSGETLKLPADGTAVLEADLTWTFPLAFAEVITGDGQSVSRDRIALENTGPFGTRKLRIPPQLAGRK